MGVNCGGGAGPLIGWWTSGGGLGEFGLEAGGEGVEGLDESEGFLVVEGEGRIGRGVDGRLEGSAEFWGARVLVGCAGWWGLAVGGSAAAGAAGAAGTAGVIGAAAAARGLARE